MIFGNRRELKQLKDKLHERTLKGYHESLEFLKSRREVDFSGASIDSGDYPYVSRAVLLVDKVPVQFDMDIDARRSYAESVMLHVRSGVGDILRWPSGQAHWAEYSLRDMLKGEFQYDLEDPSFREDNELRRQIINLDCPRKLYRLHEGEWPEDNLGRDSMIQYHRRRAFSAPYDPQCFLEIIRAYVALNQSSAIQDIVKRSNEFDSNLKKFYDGLKNEIKGAVDSTVKQGEWK